MKDKIEKILLKYAVRDYGNSMSNNFCEPVSIIVDEIVKCHISELKRVLTELKFPINKTAEYNADYFNAVIDAKLKEFEIDNKRTVKEIVNRKGE